MMLVNSHAYGLAKLVKTHLLFLHKREETACSSPFQSERNLCRKSWVNVPVCLSLSILNYSILYQREIKEQINFDMLTVFPQEKYSM